MKPVTLTAKSNYSNSPIETPLEATLKQLDCFILSIAKLTSIPQQVIELLKKLRKKKKKIERNETYAIK